MKKGVNVESVHRLSKQAEALLFRLTGKDTKKKLPKFTTDHLRELADFMDENEDFEEDV